MSIDIRELFEIQVKVDEAILVGQDEKQGRRQLIVITEGTLEGCDIYKNPMKGKVLGGGVDSQIIRPNGRCELSARYAVKLEDGRSFYIENNGIRTVPEEYAEKVKKGEFIEPELYYFATHPQFEVYGQGLEWLKNRIIVCKATRLKTAVSIQFYAVL